MRNSASSALAATADRASALLRTATRDDHDAVDAAYGAFSLSTRAGYEQFLSAHARILPVAERLLNPSALVTDWHGRTEALLGDMAELGIPVPSELVVESPHDEASLWGAIYVVEGSRLGGAVLARTVGSELPVSYLGACHPPGAWRRLLAALDAADTGPEWRCSAVKGARTMFRAYLMAAQRQAASSFP